jgi:hypothetical protein
MQLLAFTIQCGYAVGDVGKGDQGQNCEDKGKTKRNLLRQKRKPKEEGENKKERKGIERKI